MAADSALALAEPQTSLIPIRSRPCASALTADALPAVERIGALYRIEKEINGKPADERRAVRTAVQRG